MCTKFCVDLCFHYFWEFLGFMVTLSLTFWGPAPLFSAVAVPFSILSSKVWKSQFVHILTHTCYRLLSTAISVGVQWCLTVVLICGSPMINVVCLFIYLFMPKNGQKSSHLQFISCDSQHIVHFLGEIFLSQFTL